MKRFAIAAVAAFISLPAEANEVDTVMYHFQACIACLTVSMDDGVTGDAIIAQTAMQTCRAYETASMLYRKGYAHSYSEAASIFYQAALASVRQARISGYCPPNR